MEALMAHVEQKQNEYDQDKDRKIETQTRF
jgi:hypothetical protein